MFVNNYRVNNQVPFSLSNQLADHFKSNQAIEIIKEIGKNRTDTTT